MTVFTPDEILPPHALPRAELRRRVAMLRRFAWMMDAAVGVPGTRFRFGLDTLLGLVPGAGDAAAGVLSLVIVWQAYRLGVSRLVLARMVANVAVEVVAGAVPLLGDAFDTVFKANLRNVALLEQALGLEPMPRR